jgi:Domain of unknown function (DUF4440)
MKFPIRLSVTFLLCAAVLMAQTANKASKSAAKSESKSSSEMNGSVGAAIEDMEKQGVAASLKGDPSWVEKYDADDFVSIGGNGRPMDKKTIVDKMKSGALKYSKIDIQDRKVTQYGPNVAISRSTANVKVSMDGAPIEGTFTASRTWLKRNGKWQSIAFQSTQKR